MQSTSGFTTLLPAFFPIFFICMWIGVGYAISHTGWKYFAEKYPAAARPAGRSFGCSYARFGPKCSYKNVLRIVVSEPGIYVYVMFLFRAFHPPFLLPWKTVIGVSRRKMLWINWCELEIRDGDKQIVIRLSRKALEEFEKFERFKKDSRTTAFTPRPF